MTSVSTVAINGARLWQSIADMAKIGALPNGGSCRTCLSEDDRKGRDLFVRWCVEAGCEVSVDAIGNIFARRHGRDANLSSVATGSHLDTQPHGGKFDGIYGVLAGLEVVRALNDADIATVAPIDVVMWTNEEGVRFGPPLTGSCVYAGRAALDKVHASVTLDGTTVGEDLKTTGYLGEEVPGSRQFDSFIEAHIEQGPILEARSTQIGVVTQVQGIRWLEVCVMGRDAHAGTTPMDRRSDAMRGAAQMITEMNQVAIASGEATRLTIGKLKVEPNSGSTIPGQVDFNCDLRHPDGETMNRLDRDIEGICHRVAAELGLSITVRRPIDIAPTDFDPSLVDAIRNAAGNLGYSNIDMLSGAGHDAMNVASVAPAAMIFVPCKDGISHNEAESAEPNDLAAGAHVLLHAMLARARAD